MFRKRTGRRPDPAGSGRGATAASTVAATACLDEEEVVAFSAGLASEEQLARIERHLDECPRCFDWIAMMAKAPPAALARTLELSPGEPAVPAPAGDGAMPQRLGRYELVAELGAGAMGVVYRAFDTVLRRFVALKLIRPASGAELALQAEQRLLAEAHALARVAHPNVVSIYDAGLIDGQLFIALELIDGVTLTRWQVGRSWQEIVACYIASARGLAAVHDHGLVHRDFKPDNVLVAGDRVVVSDFGLACLLDRPGELGRLRVGTPAYMAPEQFRGEPPNQRTDIFNFCASLYHSLYGQPAFDGDTMTARAKAVLKGCAHREARTPLPRWLKAVLRRGLATDPAARPATVEALIQLLQHEERIQRRRVWLGVAGAVAAIVLLALSLWRERAPLYACRSRAAVVKEGWSAARRQPMRAAFTRHGTPFALDTWSRVNHLFGRYYQTLGESYQRACEATYRDRTQSATTLDLRVACLESRQVQANTLADLLSVGTEERMRGAVPAVLGLTPVAGCDNVDSLTAPLPLPTEPAALAATKRARDALAAGRAARLVADYAKASERLTGASTEAERSGHIPTQAEVELERATLARDLGDWSAAERGYEYAFSLGERGRTDSVRIFAALELVNVVGYRLFRLAEGERWASRADDLLARLGRPDEDAAELTMSRGLMLLRANQLDEAEQQLRQSLALRERSVGRSHYLFASSMQNLAQVLFRRARYTDATKMLMEAHATAAKSLGESHPRAVFIMHDLATINFNRGQLRDARQQFEHTLTLLPPRSSYEALVRRNLAETLAALGDHRAAIDEASRALLLYREGHEVVQEARTEVLIAREWARLGDRAQARLLIAPSVTRLHHQLGDSAPATLEAESTLAEIDERDGRYDAALARVDTLLSRARAAHTHLSVIANLEDLFGRALLHSHRPRDAVAHHKEALRLRSPEETLDVARTLTNLGWAELETNEDAAASFERAVSLQKSGDASPEERADASFGLAQSLEEQAGMTRATSLATTALRIYQDLGPSGASRSAAVDEWMTKHKRKGDGLWRIIK